ncbi:MAG: hypothetical protein IPO43_17445 [Rhodoferax sp.]|nr:hypothetical protein [Rhodoferax sp.]
MEFPGWLRFYDAAKPRADKHELWVTNGRINEVWQSGFDDRRKPYTAARGLAQLLFMNEQDAKARGIANGDTVRITNDTVYVRQRHVLWRGRRRPGLQQPAGQGAHQGGAGQLRRSGRARLRHARRRDQGRLQPERPSSQRGVPCGARPDDQQYRYKLPWARGAGGQADPVGEAAHGPSLKPRGLA